LMYSDGNAKVTRKIPVRVVEDDERLVSSVERPIDVDGTGDLLPRGEEAPSSTGVEPDWHSLALRLQAEMDNFRKRQSRRVDEAITAERERLLRNVLPIVDNLERALRHDGYGDESLRKGVKLTYRELNRFLESEGAVPIEAVGQPFTPELHEAVATVASLGNSGTVVEELEKGYILGDKLLRPTRVVVAA
jgi:molecular chaperone GrpE